LVSHGNIIIKALYKFIRAYVLPRKWQQHSRHDQIPIDVKAIIGRSISHYSFRADSADSDPAQPEITSKEMSVFPTEASFRADSADSDPVQPEITSKEMSVFPAEASFPRTIY